MSTQLDDSLPEVLTNVRTRPLFVMRLEVRELLIVGATSRCIPAHRRCSRRLIRG